MNTARWTMGLVVAALFLEAGIYVASKFPFPEPARAPAQLGECPSVAQSQAREAGEVHYFDIPSGRLGYTLRCFSTESGLSEGFPYEFGEYITAPVKDRMTSRKALETMLKPTDLVVAEDTKPGDTGIVFSRKAQKKEAEL
jgi:hypothetical protein